MSLEEEVLSILSEYVEPIEKAVEKLTPKIFDTGFLVKEFGEPVYRYSPESFTEGLAKPFWELFRRGGKRWRPALTVIAYEALGGGDPGIYTLAAVPEIIHNATLIVDDVEDGSLMRRGEPCIHRIYGIDIAINAGNAYYYIPVYIAAKKLPKNMATLFLEKYLETMTKLSLGQTMDIVWHRGLFTDITEEHYLQMAAFKTGALSRFAVELAAIYAGREDLLEELGRFGEAVGTAFQIQDDYLNIFGDEARYGKEIGGDITEGKYTLMTVYALTHLSSEKAKRLRQILHSHTSDKQELTEAINLIRESGADKYAREVMRRSVHEAWNRVEPLLSQTPAKTKLKKLATFLIERTL
ncbi:MAG: polyprenyl synthetase family protein [Candidatus Caldarchaeum sp.]|uniref:Polyprenyl synthetase family protein n=1 Tax=Caldiarchaeum subterraneum TaxID=311458 RepID=A0A7C4E1Q2_CALS0|nr:polyprenyl synthetase family protein [Candidatus Caldarchaeales archaeon]MDJ0272110.1 polyprenyl synthetase family protein [Candidatus Caldarchaeales archaeon]